MCARSARAEGAHDGIIAGVHRAQADALDIEAQAKRRLADEYDAAQERGEVRGANQGRSASALEAPSVGDIGLTHKDFHDARQVREAEAADPGIVRRTLEERLASNQEPSRAALREAVTAAAVWGMRPERSAGNKNPLYRPSSAAEAAWAHLYGSCCPMQEWATDEFCDGTARNT